MRMVHGSRSPELLATASQAAKVAAIVKGGRGKVVSEEERARREARRERAAAALRESHKWERERWTEVNILGEVRQTFSLCNSQEDQQQQAAVRSVKRDSLTRFSFRNRYLRFLC